MLAVVAGDCEADDKLRVYTVSALSTSVALAIQSHPRTYQRPYDTASS